MQNWLCFLAERDGVPLSPVSHSNTNQSWISVSSWKLKRVDSAFLPVCYATCDVALKESEEAHARPPQLVVQYVRSS